MVKIIGLTVLDHYRIHFVFNDGCQKTVGFRKFLQANTLTKPLLDPEYFKQVQMEARGRGISWPNGYDVCPDNLRYYLEAEAIDLGEEETSGMVEAPVYRVGWASVYLPTF